jgi:hypothetical protein
MQNRTPKQILLIIMKDESRFTYSVPEGKSYLEIYSYVINSEGVDPNTVKSVLYFPNTLYDIEEFQYYYEEDTKTLDGKSIAVDFKIDEYRRQRALLFKALDMQFMRSMENKDCEECVEKITKIKKHLRDMPDLLPDFLAQYDIEEITKFNAFNNVYDIVIINGGSGYTEPPEITISEPDQKDTLGMQMQAKAIIENGSVTDMEITRFGSGYKSAPSVSFAKPLSGNTAMAVAGAPENDLFNLE